MTFPYPTLSETSVCQNTVCPNGSYFMWCIIIITTLFSFSKERERKWPTLELVILACCLLIGSTSCCCCFFFIFYARICVGKLLLIWNDYRLFIPCLSLMYFPLPAAASWTVTEYLNSCCFLDSLKASTKKSFVIRHNLFLNWKPWLAS